MAIQLPTQTFNAQAEMVTTKPTFKASFSRRRCILPIDGFYEWKVTGSKIKQPYFIHPGMTEDVFALAGLRDQRETAEGTIDSCTVLTTSPNSLMAAVHDWMPVILSPNAFEEARLIQSGQQAPPEAPRTL